jgi:hypothetical protein
MQDGNIHFIPEFSQVGLKLNCLDDEMMDLFVYQKFITNTITAVTNRTRQLLKGLCLHKFYNKY